MCEAISSSDPVNLVLETAKKNKQDEDANEVSGSQPYLEIVEQPQSRGFRFRYKCEGPAHGGLPGANSCKGKKSYPTVRIVNYCGPAVIMVTLVTEDMGHLHAHEIIGRNCRNGILLTQIHGGDMTTMFQNLGVIHIKRQNVQKALKERILETMKIERLVPRGQLDDDVQLSEAQESQASDLAAKGSCHMSLNVVRLRFIAYLPDSNGFFTRPLNPVFSEPIYDSKAPGASQLKICRMDKYGCCCSGNVEVFLLCEKVQKDDISIVFTERNEKGDVIWQEFGNFGSSDVHRQFAIVFRTPPYRDTFISKSVQVMIQLRRSTDGEMSEPVAFTYYPQHSIQDGIERTKVKPLPRGFIDQLSFHPEIKKPKVDQTSLIWYPPNNIYDRETTTKDATNAKLHPILSTPFHTPSSSDSSCTNDIFDQLDDILEFPDEPIESQCWFPPLQHEAENLINVSKPMGLLSATSHQLQQKSCPIQTAENVTQAAYPLSSLNPDNFQFQTYASPKPQTVSCVQQEPRTGLNSRGPNLNDILSYVPSLLAISKSEAVPTAGPQLDELLNGYRLQDINNIICNETLKDTNMRQNNRRLCKRMSENKICYDKRLQFFADGVDSSINNSDDNETIDDETYDDFVEEKYIYENDNKGLRSSHSVKRSYKKYGHTKNYHMTRNDTYVNPSSSDLNLRPRGVKIANSHSKQHAIEVMKTLVQRLLSALVKYSMTGNVLHLLTTQRHLLLSSDQNKNTLLHISIMNRRYEVFRNLLSVLLSFDKRGVSLLNCSNQPHEQTPLHLSISTNQCEVAKLLLKCGADPNKEDSNRNTLYHLAAKKGNTEILEFIMEEITDPSDFVSQLNSYNADGLAPIHLATISGSKAFVEFLLQNGVDPNQRDHRSRRTALHYAVENSKLSIASYLLSEIGVDVNAVTLDNNTPLHLACGVGAEKAVKLLLEYGADPDIENDSPVDEDYGASDDDDDYLGHGEFHGSRPADLAQGHPAILQILKKHSRYSEINGGNISDVIGDLDHSMKSLKLLSVAL